MTKIQVFIATYNRPLLVVKAIKSVLNQSFDSFEIIISDNSTTDETERIIEKMDDHRLIYKRRVPSLSFVDHLNAILQDVSADYFMIFHDDDIMHPNMISQQKKLFERHGDELIAVACNARIVKNDRAIKRAFFPDSKGELIIKDQNELVHSYFTLNHPPFPSYLYRGRVAKELKFDIRKGGKYCDVAFLIDVAKLGTIGVTKELLMDYYIHPNQVSTNSALTDQIKLVNYIAATTIYKRYSKLTKKFRIMNLYSVLSEMISGGNFNYSQKRAVRIYMIMAKNSTFGYFPRLLIKQFVVSKIKRLK